MHGWLHQRGKELPLTRSVCVLGILYHRLYTVSNTYTLSLFHAHTHTHTPECLINEIHRDIETARERLGAPDMAKLATELESWTPN